MPHAEIKYSDDLNLPTPQIFARIEQIINDHDPTAGACKGRAYPSAQFHHSHVVVELSLLAKPNRGADFTAALMAAIETGVKELIDQPCAFSLLLSYSPSSYVTNLHKP